MGNGCIFVSTHVCILVTSTYLPTYAHREDAGCVVVVLLDMRAEKKRSKLGRSGTRRGKSSWTTPPRGTTLSPDRGWSVGRKASSYCYSSLTCDKRVSWTVVHCLATTRPERRTGHKANSEVFFWCFFFWYPGCSNHCGSDRKWSPLANSLLDVRYILIVYEEEVEDCRMESARSVEKELRCSSTYLNDFN